MKVKHSNKVIEGVNVIDTSSEGLAVARIEDMVVFIEGAVPGDICTIQIHTQKRKFAMANLVKIEKPSTLRVKNKCVHFGVCGGCKWQNLSYESQLQFKFKSVKDALERVGKLDLPEMLPILGSEENYYYRNKLDFSFSNKRWLTREQIQSGETFEDRDGLGFHIPRAFDKVLDISECHLQEEPSNSIRNGLKEFAIKNNLSFFRFGRNKVSLGHSLFVRLQLARSWLSFSFAITTKNRFNSFCSI
jgi:23S rRNA (uracil1939-C5)-methyltransferase